MLLWGGLALLGISIVTLSCGELAKTEEPPTRLAMFRDRIVQRMQARISARRTVCYEMVGCFAVHNRHSPLQPDSPATLKTRFLLYTRANASTPTLLLYGDQSNSIRTSDFDPDKSVKVIVHGFKGSGKDRGAIAGATAFLKQGDVNVVLVDWERGAAGPRYPTAVANTEVVGRQLGLLLLDMLVSGISPADIHLVGHSLGAHVAAVASHVLKERGVVLGRITGLDPASPLFKHQILTDDARKLDPSDARFVDVIHTDGSPIWTDGFGLLRPLGHVDFFPNGGREQPGCSDGRGSVVVSLLEGLNSSIACSHVRAWQLFLESINLDSSGQGCQFMAWPCQAGLPGFRQGHCFPVDRQCSGDSKHCNMMGEQADQSQARGAMYLVTRPTSPFCGVQLRATVSVSEKTQRTRGLMFVRLQHGTGFTGFNIKCDFLDVLQGGRLLWGLSAADWGSISPTATPNLSATVSYQSLGQQTESETNEPTSGPVQVFFDKVIIADHMGNSWQYCGKDTLLNDEANGSFNQVNIALSLGPCTT